MRIIIALVKILLFMRNKINTLLHHKMKIAYTALYSHTFIHLYMNIYMHGASSNYIILHSDHYCHQIMSYALFYNDIE